MTTAECFVYLQMPGSTEVVTCGRFRQVSTRSGATEGVFVYGERYRARRDAVELVLVQLSLGDRERRTTKLNGIFGALRDAAPDAWGRRIIERELGREDLSELEYLLNGPDDRAGALSFGIDRAPPAPTRTFNRVVTLPELLAAARTLDDRKAPLSDPRLRQLANLLHPGTSLGGARPKNVVEDDDGLWVAKFPQRGDRWDNATVEAAMLALAARCEIQVPDTRLESIGTDHVLLVRRFDRVRTDDGYLRHRFASAVTVLGADDGGTDLERWSYVLLADELRRWSTRLREDQRELYRRMVFNALVSNNDDHPRNHALIAPTGWRLAPAFDITPNPQTGSHDRHLALQCGAFGRTAKRANLVSLAPRFSYTQTDAASVIDRMKGIVEREWRNEVQRQGGTARDCDAIAPAMLDEGFEYDIAPEARA